MQIWSYSKTIATYRYYNNNFSILNRQMHLKEIDIWFSIMKIIKNKFKSKLSLN